MRGDHLSKNRNTPDLIGHSRGRCAAGESLQPPDPRHLCQGRGDGQHFEWMKTPPHTHFDRMQRRAETTKVAAPSMREDYLPAGHNLGKDAAPGDQSRADAVALDDPKQQAAAQPCHQDAVPLDQARPQQDADRRARFR